jgi:hypothetical protein
MHRSLVIAILFTAASACSGGGITSNPGNDAMPGGSGGTGGGGGTGNIPPDGATCGTANGIKYVKVYESALSRWCIDPNEWSAHKDKLKTFFSYGDHVITDLQTLFAVSPKGLPFTYQVKAPFGGAHTGSDFGLGDTVTGDAFYNDYRDPVSHVNVPGFYGYLLTLHEAINVWTGTVSSGWPTDWWADHRSPFPNSMDYHVMQTAGTADNDAALLAAAKAQHEEFGIPGVARYDTEVAMFDDLFDKYGGFEGLQRIFKLIEADGAHWDDLGDNPSALRSHYVIAYLQLGLGTTTDLTASTFTAAGVGKLDDSISYTPDPGVVGDIADAHCSIAAATHDPAIAKGTIDAALDKLRHGDYAAAKVASKACQKTDDCPAECGCDGQSHQCVARWRAP